VHSTNVNFFHASVCYGNLTNKRVLQDLATIDLT